MKFKELLSKPINFSYKFSWEESSTFHKVCLLAAVVVLIKVVF